MISFATCHHLSGTTWPANCHRSHHQTTGQRRQMTVFNGGKRRWSTAADGGQRWRTTVDHCRTTGQWSGQVATSAATSAGRSLVRLCGTATSADWVPLPYVAATSATDVAEGIITL
uniref:Uncharacterized protein n=1 Tax=Tanacetum cinerariifolium TaxID=118510 RepID=A0A699JBQ0_TANCI|nr:hypothetical protein [Tanacetum cinerariifolium]